MALRVRFVIASAALLLAGANGAAEAAKPSWDRTANIKAAALHLAELQVQKGAFGAYQFISACYRTHQLASDFGAPLEACLVQDYIHSKVAAAVYDKLPPADRDKIGLPAPGELVTGMLRRFGDAMAAYKLKEADARRLIADIDRHGVPAFTAARFPSQ